MDNNQTIAKYRALIMQRKPHTGLSPKQVTEYERAILQSNVDDRVEFMMIYCAEALHDLLGYKARGIRKILKEIDRHMVDFADDPTTEHMDADRMRVFEKTGFVFATSLEDQDRLVQQLEAKGYKVIQREDGCELIPPEEKNADNNADA